MGRAAQDQAVRLALEGLPPRTTPRRPAVLHAARPRPPHLDGFPCFLTTAHTDADVELIVKAFRESVAEMQEAGFLPAASGRRPTVDDATPPPVPGARLGRDRSGNPAWFVPNPEAAGQVREGELRHERGRFERSRPAVDFDPFAGPAHDPAVPSTEPQREIWTAAAWATRPRCAFNESASLEIGGSWTREALRRPSASWCARHESLRSTFSADGLTLCVAAAHGTSLPLVDLVGPLRPGAAAHGWQPSSSRRWRRPSPWSGAPWRGSALLRLAAEEHVLVFTAHHIVCDGWSTAVLIEDLGGALPAPTGDAEAARGAPIPSARTPGSRPRPEPARRPRPTGWQFAEAPPALDLPADRPRPPLKTYASRRVDTVTTARAWWRLQAGRRRRRASFFATLLAGFEALLYRLTGQEDIVVGVPAAGQAAPGGPSLVGHCVNTLPLRGPSWTPTAASRPAECARCDDAVLDALRAPGSSPTAACSASCRLPRDPSRLPLVSVVFNLDQAFGAELLRFDGLGRRVPDATRGGSRTSTCSSTPWTRARRSGWSGSTTPTSSTRHRARAGALLRGAAGLRRRQTRAGPSAACRSLARGPRAARGVERATDARVPARAPASTSSSSGRRSRRPRRSPSRSRGGRLGYRELERRPTSSARRSAARGVGRGALVGLCLERSPEMVVALLGILKAGGGLRAPRPRLPDRAAGVHDLGLADAGAGDRRAGSGTAAAPPGAGAVAGRTRRRIDGEPADRLAPARGCHARGHLRTSSTPRARPGSPRASWCPTGPSSTSCRGAGDARHEGR